MPTPNAFHVARALVGQADPAECARHSYRAYHNPGVDYVNLLRSPDLTVKLYFFDPKATTTVRGGLVVNPHDHRYDAFTWCLEGEVTNVCFRKTVGGGWRECRLFAPTKELEPAAWGRCGLEETLRESFWSGGGWRLPAEQIHSLKVSNKVPTTLLQFQYASRSRTTSLFVRGKSPPGTAGLYEPASPAFVRDRLERAWDLLGAWNLGDPARLER